MGHKTILAATIGLLLFAPSIVSCGECDCHNKEDTMYTQIGFTMMNDDIIEQVGGEVANAHDYKFGVYDCDQYSRDFCIRIREYGYRCRVCSGKYTELDGSIVLHTWAQVISPYDNIKYVETTHGYIVPTHIYQKRYEEHHCK